ncbi:glycosyltransferase [Pedobacter changchengzhani]|uniref:Glycosyltransferase n=1 Tax=Pedobacter changchengzhani TaxID=2529274 RepID=A0A4R5MIA5_9SPHI|nr:glycosyltransferase [Pedobacter changchengzhani]TDG35288.1 glycosyltransferase [Pedobacter changchengzhani]
MSKIVLITSGQPSLNPRLVKEADALVEAGYEVTLIYQYWNDWATIADETLIASKKWKAIRVGGTPDTNRFSYWKLRIISKIANILSRKIGLKYHLAELSIGRCAMALSRKACKISSDLYIAHNLAALPAAVNAAKRNKAKSGFDAEDLHRYEMSNKATDIHVKLKKFIEEKYFPKVDYLTTSSPQIAAYYKKLFPKLIFNGILNVFPKQENLTIKTSNNHAIKLVWFSQNVGLSRGLQDVFTALKKLQEFEIEFYILGYLSDVMKQKFEEITHHLQFNHPPKIFFQAPIHPDDVQNYLNQFDIGLATEPAFSINNDSALSNKIFTYIQAGLAVIASDTTAQSSLLEEYPNMGMIYKKNDPASLSKVIKTYLEDRTLLLAHQKQAKKYADEELNWEVEKLKFLNIVEQTLATI